MVTHKERGEKRRVSDSFVTHVGVGKKNVGVGRDTNNKNMVKVT